MHQPTYIEIWYMMYLILSIIYSKFFMNCMDDIIISLWRFFQIESRWKVTCSLWAFCFHRNVSTVRLVLGVTYFRALLYSTFTVVLCIRQGFNGNSYAWIGLMVSPSSPPATHYMIAGGLSQSKERSHCRPSHTYLLYTTTYT